MIALSPEEAREAELRRASLATILPLAILTLSQFLPRDGSHRSPFGEAMRDSALLVLSGPFFGVPFALAVVTAFAAVRGRAPGTLASVFASIATVIIVLLEMLVAWILAVDSRKNLGALYGAGVALVVAAVVLFVRAMRRRAWEKWATLNAALASCAAAAACVGILIDEQKDFDIVWTLRAYSVGVGMLVPIALFIVFGARRARV